jgi:ribosomal protein L23
MKKNLFHLTAAVLLLLAAAPVMAQRGWNYIDPSNILSKDSISKQGYTLLFINKDSALDPQVKKRLIETFFTVYPKEVSTYNTGAARKVVFVIDPAYKGVAATSGAIVRFSPLWFHQHPEDIDVVTHEAMHIVQAYPGGSGPGWITEGIADYVRYRLGVNNEAAKWKLPDYAAKQKYDNSYRITARFFVWIENKYNKKLVQELDAAMRNKKYTEDIWKQLTGKTVDELWAEYGANPVV